MLCDLFLPSDGCEEIADEGGWTVDGLRWTVDGGRETVDGGRITVDGGPADFNSLKIMVF